MKRNIRVVSFILALALLLGCLPTAIFASEAGGARADGAAGDTDGAIAEAIGDKMPSASGIMTVEQIAALIGEGSIAASNPCDTKGKDTNSFQTVIDETGSGGRKYIKVGETPYTADGDGNKIHTTPFTCGTTEETFVQLDSKYTQNHAGVAQNYATYKGRAIVISADIRLEAGYDIPETALMDVRTYLAVNASGAPDSVGIRLINIRADGTLVVNGTELEKKVNKSTAECAAEFTTVAVHIIPEENTYRVFVDGVCQTDGIETVLIDSEKEKLLTFKDAEYKANGATVTVSADGHRDFTFGWARFMHIYSTYHGQDCPDGCTAEKNGEETRAPFNFVGDQFSLDSMKAYYSDFYLECTEHDIAIGEHTHDEDSLSACVSLTCKNCLAKWEISIPMDQTGNALCDLCEIENSDVCAHDEAKLADHVHDYGKKCISVTTECTRCGAVREYTAALDADGDKICDVCVSHRADTSARGTVSPSELAALVGKENIIISSDCTVGAPTFGFSSVANSNGCISARTEDGNTFIQYSAKKSSGEAYLNATRNAGGAAMLNNFNRDAGRAFVYSIDVRLGESFNLTQNIFQILAYMVPTSTNDAGEATAFTATNVTYVNIDSSGMLYYRDPRLATGSGVTSATGYRLEKGATEFTTVSIHVRPRDGELGLYTVYVNGRAIVKDIPFMNAQESEQISWTASNGTVSRGVKDYTLGFIRSFHVTASNTVSDGFVSVDNPKLYYSDSFTECAGHIFTVEGHEHDLAGGVIRVKLKCHCGAEGSELTLPIDTLGDGKCDSCGAHLLAEGAIVTGRQVTVGKYVALRFYTRLDSSLTGKDDAKIVITANGEDVKFKISDARPDDDGNYIFEIRLSPDRMSENVTIALESDGAGGSPYVTSITDCMKEVLTVSEDVYEQNLCRATLNYGASMQNYIAHESGDTVRDPANGFIDDKYKDLSYITADSLRRYGMRVSGVENGTEFTGARLIAGSTLSLKVFFTAQAGCTVTVDGQEAEAKAADGMYSVTVGGLLPYSLGKEHTVTVTVDGKERTVTLSALSAAYSALADEGEGEDYRALCRAAYLYALASDMYVADSDSERAQIVVKDGAKGAVAIVLDDGDQTAANYVAEYLKKYDKTAASFALITSHLATLVKQDGEYVMSEDGKYTFTQTDEQKKTTEYWRNYLQNTDINGNTVGSRVELISHSHTHAAPKDGDNYAELLAPRHILQGLFGYNSEALITPGGFSVDDSYNDVRVELYIGCRGTNASENVYPMINTLSEFDKAKRKRFDSFMVQYNKMWLNEQGKFSDATISAKDAIKLDADGNADISQVEKFIDCAMENNALAAFCIHGIVPDTYNGGTNKSGLHIYEQQAEAIFKYVQKHAETGDLWATTYSEALKYFCEWNTAKLDVRLLSNEMIAVSLTDSEDDAVFDTELTVKLRVDDSWTSARAMQNGICKELEIRSEAGARYVLVNILPDSGIVTVEGTL